MSRFDAVLGARRGSTSAQAIRDAQEGLTQERKRQAQDAELTKMIALIDEDVDLLPSSRAAIDRLATAHRAGLPQVDSPEYKKLCEELNPNGAIKFTNLANVAVHGDPEHWPGLTAPAVNTIENLLHPDVSDTRESIVLGPAPLRAQITADTILQYDSKSDPKQYERLAPALGGMVALTPLLSSNHRGLQTAKSMTRMLFTAPTQALDGPLQPLVQALAQRILDWKLTPNERWVLDQAVLNRALSGQRAEALRPITDALWREEPSAA